jgi:cytochrome c-type biogenesis protein CcmH
MSSVGANPTRRQVMIVSPSEVVFALIALVMVLVTVALAGWPWFRERIDTRVARTSYNVQVYRGRLAELENEMKNGRIGRDQSERERGELGRGILEDVGPDATGPGTVPPPPNPRSGRLALVVIALAIPILAVLLYLALNVSIEALAAEPPPATAQAPQAPRGAPAGGGAGPQAGKPSISIGAMVDRLATLLEQNPNDQEGWTLLGRSYMVLQRYGEAAGAYRNAYELASAEGLAPDDASLVADYGEALAMANDNRPDAQVARLVNQALQLDGGNMKALWWAGMAAFRAQDYPTAVERWKNLEQRLPPGHDMSDILASALEEAEIRAGMREVEPLVEPAAEASGGG